MESGGHFFRPAALDVRDDAGRTALYMAAENGHSDAVRLLLNAGADGGARANLRAQLVMIKNKVSHNYEYGATIEGQRVIGCFVGGQSDDLSAVVTAGLWAAGLPAATVGEGRWRYEVVVVQRGLVEGPYYHTSKGELMVRSEVDEFAKEKAVRARATASDDPPAFLLYLMPAFLMTCLLRTS